MHKMTNHIDHIIDNYEASCQLIAREFVGRYFGRDLKYNKDFYWIGGRVGELILVSDYFFSNTDMVTILLEDWSYETLIEWHEQWAGGGEKIVNAKNWKFTKGFTKREKVRG